MGCNNSLHLLQCEHTEILSLDIEVQHWTWHFATATGSRDIVLNPLPYFLHYYPTIWANTLRLRLEALHELAELRVTADAGLCPDKVVP